MTESDAYHGWYGLNVWQRLRRACLASDGWRCRMCGVVLYQFAPLPHSPVVDHIKPHRGDWSLFTDPANLQALCKQCHDGAKRAAELRGWHDMADSDGWPLDPSHPANRNT